MTKRHYNFLILGQGLAGSLTGWLLEKEQQDYLIIDIPYSNAASTVSAGIVNPLIGQSFNLPWNFLEMNNLAKDCYLELSEYFQTSFVEELEILRVLNNPKQEETIKWKLEDPTYQQFIGETTSSYQNLTFPHNAFWTTGSYWVELSKLIQILKSFFKEKNRYLELEFDYNKLQVSETRISYQDLTFDQIIFAEGYRAMNNPWAKFLEFRPAKGEILDLEIPDLNLEKILHFGHFLLPLKNNLYRLGATYGWSAWETALPLNNIHPLLIAFSQIIPLPFRVIKQSLGVRPIVSGQKPVLGNHPKFKNLYFLNGLGSKGALQTPFCAKMLVNQILRKVPIHSALSTDRFVF